MRMSMALMSANLRSLPDTPFSPGFPLIHSPLFSLFESQGIFGEHGAAARQLHEQGYLLVDLGRERMTALADRIRSDLAGSFDLQAWQASGGCGDLRVQDAWQESDAVRELALLPDIQNLLQLFWGRKPFAFQTLNFPVGTRQHFHSDAVHFHSEPPGFMCGVWVALEDIHPEAGPLEYYPASHQLPYLQPRDVNYHQMPGCTPDQSIFHQIWSDELKAHRLERQVFTPRLGQALIWTANLIHGGAAVSDYSRTRWSQVTHFFFEGCRWYTPMLSDWPLGAVAWRQPLDVATGLERNVLELQETGQSAADYEGLFNLEKHLHSGDLDEASGLLKQLITASPALSEEQWLVLRENLNTASLLPRLRPLLDVITVDGADQGGDEFLARLCSLLQPQPTRYAVDCVLDLGDGVYLVYGWSLANPVPELVARGRRGSWSLGRSCEWRLRRPDVKMALQLDAAEDCGFIIPFILPSTEPLDILWLDGVRITSEPLVCSGFPYLELVDDLLNRCHPHSTPLPRLARLLPDVLGDLFLHLRQPLRQQHEWLSNIETSAHFGSLAEEAEITLVIPLFGRWDFVLGQLAAFSMDAAFVKGCAKVLYVVDDPEIATEFLGWCQHQLSDEAVNVDILVLRRNMGFSMACNIGVLQASTERVCLLNSDVLPLGSGWLDHLNASLNQQRDALIAPLLLFDTGRLQHAGMEISWSSSTQLFATCQHPLKGLDPSQFAYLDAASEPYAVEALSGAALFFERDRFLALDGFDPVFGRGDFEDLEFSLRWQRLQGPCLVVPASRLTHLERQSIGTDSDPLTIWRRACNAWMAEKLSREPAESDD